jgi:cysteinyl-tRNA synthetase
MQEIRFYDTATRRVKAFRPLRKGEVRIYSCGPSVYDASHLGNFRTYVFEDAVKRVLLSAGYRVRHVMNITDIEDKSVRAAKGRMGRMRALTRRNEAGFMRTASRLNMLPADRYPRATGNIRFMEKMIRKLLARRFAYRDEKGNVFMDVSRVRGYGDFSRSSFVHGLDRHVMKDDYYQREAGDFLLWKAWRKGDGDIFWRTSLGKGRPGWHIECSAMGLRFLGAPYDIHEGGVDNIFSHHENEIAQTRGATGKEPARYWLHCRHLLVEGRKMSKSLGNFYTVEEIHKMGFGYDAIRAHLLGTHYRKRMDFTFSGLRKVAEDLRRCRSCISTLCGYERGEENPDADDLARTTLASFHGHVCNDFDFPAAMDDSCHYVRRIEKLIKSHRFGTKNARLAWRTMLTMDEVLGFMVKGGFCNGD